MNCMKLGTSIILFLLLKTLFTTIEAKKHTSRLLLKYFAGGQSWVIKLLMSQGASYLTQLKVPVFAFLYRSKFFFLLFFHNHFLLNICDSFLVPIIPVSFSCWLQEIYFIYPKKALIIMFVIILSWYENEWKCNWNVMGHEKRMCAFWSTQFCIVWCYFRSPF